MSSKRIPGVIGSDELCYVEGHISSGVAVHASHQINGPIQDSDGLTPEQVELALDLTQFILDLVGIVEPTPTADGTNMVISLGRRDWLGATISLVSVLPYVGDLAKLGKLGAYGRSISRLIDVAKVDVRFANFVDPALRQLHRLLSSIPLDKLPKRVREICGHLKSRLDNYFGAGKKANELAELTDRILIAVKGSTKNVGEIARLNAEEAASFMLRHGIDESYFTSKVLSGFDMSKSIQSESISKGTVFIQNYDPVRGMGSWFTKAGSGVGSESVGIAQGVRQTKYFEVTQPVDSLRGTASSTMDGWTPGRAPGTIKGSTHDKVVARGGGEQFFFPRAIQYDPVTKTTWPRWQTFMKEYIPPKKRAHLRGGN